MSDEYGVQVTPMAAATSPWVHYTCDSCGAKVRMKREDAHRPKTWATVTIHTTIGNTVTTVCGKCMTASAVLLRLLCTAYDDG